VAVTVEPTPPQQEAAMSPNMRMPYQALPCLSWTDLLAVQQADEVLGPIISSLRAKAKKRSLRNYAFNAEGILMRKRNHKREKRILLFCVPYALRHSVLESCHDCPLAGHFGIKKTYERIISHYFWHGIYRDVERWVGECQTCQRAKPRHHTTGTAPICSLPIVRKPFERVHLDLVTLGEAKDGYKYAVVVTDVLTKWVEVAALKDQSTKGIAQFLVDSVFLRHGPPTAIYTDQGKQFCSGLYVDLTNLMGAKRLRTSPLHPASNGSVEAFNKTLIRLLMSLVEDDKENWPAFLPVAMWAYRTAIHATVKETPFYLLYGRDPYPIIPLRTEEEQPSLHEYVSNLKTRLERAHEASLKQLSVLQETYKKRNEAMAARLAFSEGDLVLLNRSYRRQKLRLRWSEPHRVIKVLPNLVNVQVGKVLSGSTEIDPATVKIVHVARLKLFKQRKSYSQTQTVLNSERADNQAQEETIMFFKTVSSGLNCNAARGG